MMVQDAMPSRQGEMARCLIVLALALLDASLAVLVLHMVLA